LGVRICKSTRIFPSMYCLSKDALSNPNLENAIGGKHPVFEESYDNDLSVKVQTFLEKKDKIFVTVSLGSMKEGNDPLIAELYRRMVYKNDQLRKIGNKTIGLILVRGWSDLLDPKFQALKEDTENVFVTAGEPYSKLFKEVDIVLHHGGAGTQTDAVRAGAFSLVQAIVEDIDQPNNGKFIESQKLGFYLGTFRKLQEDPEVYFDHAEECFNTLLTAIHERNDRNASEMSKDLNQSITDVSKIVQNENGCNQAADFLVEKYKDLTSNLLSKTLNNPLKI